MKLAFKSMLNFFSDNGKDNLLNLITNIESSTSDDNPVIEFNEFKNFIFELENSNSFDRLLKDDLLNGVDLDKIKSIHAFCYENSASVNSYVPKTFEVYSYDGSSKTKIADLMQFSLIGMSDFSNLSIGFRNIAVPSDSKYNFVVVVMLKE